MIFLAACQAKTSFLSNPSWWQVISSFVVSFLALFFGLELQKKILKPNFVYELKETEERVNQSTTYAMYRLLVRNIGHRQAQGVNVMLVEILDKKGKGWKMRENFIHMPLKWTHLDQERTINIAAHQEVYVNVGLYDLSGNDDRGFIITCSASVEEHDLYTIEGDSRIKIRFSEQNGFTDSIVLQVLRSESGKPRITKLRAK